MKTSSILFFLVSVYVCVNAIAASPSRVYQKTHSDIDGDGHLDQIILAYPEDSHQRNLSLWVSLSTKGGALVEYKDIALDTTQNVYTESSALTVLGKVIEITSRRKKAAHYQWEETLTIAYHGRYELVLSGFRYEYKSLNPMIWPPIYYGCNFNFLGRYVFVFNTGNVVLLEDAPALSAVNRNMLEQKYINTFCLGTY